MQNIFYSEVSLNNDAYLIYYNNINFKVDRYGCEESSSNNAVNSKSRLWKIKKKKNYNKKINIIIVSAIVDSLVINFWLADYSMNDYDTESLKK